MGKFYVVEVNYWKGKKEVYRMSRMPSIFMGQLQVWHQKDEAHPGDPSIGYPASTMTYIPFTAIKNYKTTEIDDNA